ncbi:EAL and HDOD domain-containing protein [Nitrincola sp. MINF-07-Sa-05]|uniref:EAL and HDOD domain-containing protein n=1 Tax=Nitrincola salilacus TaxID=3400273 RepID=UPI0039184644
MEKVFVGRQPIFDQQLSLQAYELLFRSSMQNTAVIGSHDFDQDMATTNVMLNTFIDIGLEQMVETYPAYINLSRSFLIGSLPLPFSPNQVVLEILEDIKTEPEVIAAIKGLKEKGYIVALDDFIDVTNMLELVQLVDIIKVDVQPLSTDELASLVVSLRKINPATRLLAEKVEDKATFEYCKSLGFVLFQGYFFCRPQVVEGTRLSGNRLEMLNLMAELQDSETDFARLEYLIARDVALSYRLLRYINSAAFGMRRSIESIRQVLTLLGMNKIKNIVCLILLSEIDDKPKELMTLSMIRGKMCELLAQKQGLDGADQYFTVGLFSLLDAIMDRPLPELVNNLPLSALVKDALLEHKGEAGMMLSLVEQFESGRWDQLMNQPVSPEIITGAWIDAVQWAHESTDSLKG